MEPLTLALWIVVATLAVLATGIPIAFGLALVSSVFFSHRGIWKGSAFS